MTHQASLLVRVFRTIRANQPINVASLGRLLGGYTNLEIYRACETLLQRQAVFRFGNGFYSARVDRIEEEAAQ